MDEGALAVRRWVEKDPVKYLYLREFYRRGAELCCDGEDGIALKSDKYNILYTAGRNPECPELYSSEFCLTDSAELKDRLMATGRFTGFAECSQALYLSREHAPVSPEIRIVPLTEADADFVVENYHNAGAYREHILGRIAEGMLGATVNGRLAGFAGVHMEGTVGLLEVLPEYRRRGLAEALEAAVINRLLDEGRLPYCHIKTGNTASFCLQEKLGLTVDHRKVYWLG